MNIMKTKQMNETLISRWMGVVARLTAGLRRSADCQPAVSQVVNLPTVWGMSTRGRPAVGETADWQSALRGLAFLLALAPSLFAQPIDDAVFSIGTTTTNAQGAPWAYVLWQPTEVNALAGRKIAVYAKTGDAASNDSYARRTITQRQTDPLIIQSLLQRAQNLGEDLNQLEMRVDALFSAAMPRQTLTLSEKVSAVIRGTEKDPQLLANVVFLGRLHPSLNICLGHAWAEPIAASGKTTFEIRDFDLANNRDRGVMGRVTVDPANPIVLPAPGRPVQFIEESATGDLNIKLRWATPDALREVGLLQHGYNVYRMTSAFAQAQGFHQNPPSRDQLLSLLATQPQDVKPINHTPVTVNRLYDVVSVIDFDADRTWYLADDNGRYQPDGMPFFNGEAFYYFTTARDLLGRDGHVSPGGFALACDRSPPNAVEAVAVENEYSVNPGNGQPQQFLQVSWKQIEDLDETVTGYYVYRWTNAVEAQTVGLTNQLLNRIAGPILPVAGDERLSYIDNGPGSPQAPDDYGKTFWYTVRAVDDGACAGNFSANSSPVFGVLRDRTAPDPSDGYLITLCCKPALRSDKDFLTPDATATDTNLAYYKFTITRTNQALAFAEFYYHANGETNVLGRLPFPKGNGPLVFQWSTHRDAVGAGIHRTFAKVFDNKDQETLLVEGSSGALPAVGLRHDVNFFAWMNCFPVVLRDGPVEVDCGSYTPVWPEDDETVAPPIVVFTPAPKSKEFRLYRRVDFGPLTLIKQGPITNDPPVAIPCPDPNPPANSGFVCYFVQTLDENGNAGARVQIGPCLRVKLKTPRPLLSPLVSEGVEDAPKMAITWFCPPFGVERFEVFIAPNGGASMPPDISPQLTLNGGPQPVEKWVQPPKSPFPWKRQFYVYRTPRVGPTFGDGGFFQVNVDIELNHSYLVFIKPVGFDGEPDPDSQNSNVESFKWEAKELTGPSVPWPARPLPSITTNAYPSWVRPVFINNTNLTTNFVGVGIIVGTTGRPAVKRQGTNPPAIDGAVPPLEWIAKSVEGNRLFPLVAYRFQEPNANYPAPVSGDIVQVTPLMDKIAFALGNHPQMGLSEFIHDPFIDVLPTSFFDEDTEGRNALVLLDTQPVLIGARYRYLLVRFEEDGEVAEVIPTVTVDVQ